MRLTTFVCPPDPAPDPDFREKYEDHGGFFEGRLILPLYTPRGQLCGWDSRATTYKSASRFILPRARWNPTFVGMPRMMPRIWARQPVWIAEGLFDLFALEQLYPDAAILGAGTARLVPSQLDFLQRFASEVNLVFDRDKTGREGTEKALKDLRYRRVECRDIPYRGGKDPGEIWDSGGLTALRECFPRQ